MMTFSGTEIVQSFSCIAKWCVHYIAQYCDQTISQRSDHIANAMVQLYCIEELCDHIALHSGVTIL